jgi:hypothetical protein
MNPASHATQGEPGAASPGQTPPAIRTGYWAAALAAAGAAFWFNYHYIINHFLHGPNLHDTGWFGGTIYHPTWDLIDPPALGDNVSFYNTHISPILFFLGLPSYWLPDILPVYYAKVIGVVYGSLGLAGTLAAEPLTRAWGWRGPLAAGLVGLGLAFSGLSLAAIGYPHFEPLYAGLAVLFLALLFRGQWKWAALPFGLAVMVREDCGLHLFGILGLLYLCSWRVPTLRPWRRQLLGYALAGLAYSLSVIALQKIFYHTDNALQRIYLGNPPFAHVTAALIQQRVVYYLLHNKYILVPGLLVAALAAVRRSWLLLAGAASMLPWVLFNFFAKADAAGNLSLYYSFPLLVMLIWPILIYPLDPQRRQPGAALAAGWMVLGSSLFLYDMEQPAPLLSTLHGGFSSAVFSTSDYEQGQHLVAALVRQSPDIVFENAVAGLYPFETPKRQVITDDSSRPPPKMLVGFIGGWEHPFKLLGTNTRWSFYTMVKPHLYILSQEPLPAGILTTNPLLGKGLANAPLVFPYLILGPYAKYDADDNISDLVPHSDQVVEYGPYIQLASGSYAVHFQWEASEATADDKLTFAVTIQAGKTTLTSTEIKGTDLTNRTGLQSVTLIFHSQGTDELEFILRKSGVVKIKLKDIQVEMTGNVP